MIASMAKELMALTGGSVCRMKIQAETNGICCHQKACFLSNGALANPEKIRYGDSLQNKTDDQEVSLVVRKYPEQDINRHAAIEAQRCHGLIRQRRPEQPDQRCLHPIHSAHDHHCGTGLATLPVLVAGD